jgi:hypothetical protein
VKRAIIEASGKAEGEVNAAFEANAVPLTEFPTPSDCIRAWALIDGKYVTSKIENPDNLTARLGCDIYGIANKMKAEEISEDLRAFINEVITFAR